MRRRWLAAVLMASFVGQSAGADVLCRGRGSRVFIRASCKRREMPLDFPKGPTGDAGSAAGPPVRIVDAAGVPVGLFAQPANEDNTPTVLLEVGTRLVTFFIGPAGFDQNAQLYYEAAHCAGSPLVPPFFEAPLVRNGYVLGSTAYYAEDPFEVHTVASYEEAKPSTGCGVHETLSNGHCCVALLSPAPSSFGPAQAFDVPPLTLPLHLEP